ncbi:integral membrane protein [Colletotrichum musicola]|uniref:Integral membrane protein n=1 Tax=Colletotrichum musicola TaxID=2175873 RepID=A0A8H6KKK3_9PEZI|nr:integral membrane protein [Colletotrichum musicola]
MSTPALMNSTTDARGTFPLERQSQVSVVAVSVVFIILPTVAVFLRLVARRMAHRGMDASDYCIIGACVFSHALQAVSISSVTHGGVGFLFREIIPKYGRRPIITFLQLLVVQQILWAVSLSLCKIAILLLYTKIFSVRRMVLATRVMVGFTIAWTVAAVLVAFFICIPLSDNWLLDLKNRRCGNQPAADGTLGVVNMMTDIIVLVMPVSYLWRLHLETYKKAALIVTFSLGVFTCIVSGLRLYYLSQLSYTDVTFGIPNALIFSALEPGVGITLACIPFLRPLLGRSQYSQKGTAQYYTTAEGRSGNSARAERYRGFTVVDETSSQYQLRQYGQDERDPVPELPGKVHVTSQGTESTRDSY